MTFLLNLITAAVLYGTPLLYGTSGEILTEKSGNLNLGVEGMMFMGGALGLGAAGTGGDTVCLALKMERAHTHTAIAPVAINFHCWVARRAGIRIYDDGRVEKLL